MTFGDELAREELQRVRQALGRWADRETTVRAIEKLLADHRAVCQDLAALRERLQQGETPVTAVEVTGLDSSWTRGT